MAAADWRTAALIASIRRRGNAPVSNSGWNDADFLAALNEDLRSYVVPLIRRINEDYLVAYTDVSVTSASARYRIPEAALGESLRDVGFLDLAGLFVPIERVDAGRRSAVGGYYLEDEDVVLTPAPTISETMRLKYVRRPSKLVADARCYSITTVNVGSLVTTNLDTDETTTIAASALFGATPSYDVVSARPGFRALLEGAAGTASTTTITDADVVAALGIAVGDYVCVPGEAPVPQIPAEAHPLLAQATLCQYLRASNQPGIGEAEARRAQMEAELTGLFAPRTQESSHRIVNRFGPGWAGFRRWKKRLT